MKRLLGLGWIVLLATSAPLKAEGPPPFPPTSEVKARFLALLDRPRVPPDPRAIELKPRERGLVAERLDFATERRADGSIERVPTLLVRPERVGAGTRLPVVIALHGTGGNKEGLLPWLYQLARRGFIAVAIDGRYHGERARGTSGTTAYNEAIIRAWRSKPGEPPAHPFYFDTCWDVWRLIDVLQGRPDVDPDRIGLMGISKGGIETWLAGAVDDRVKVAVPLIAVQSFRWSLDHDRWEGRANTIRESHEAAAVDLGESGVNAKVCRALWDKVIPGILDVFDAPSQLRLFAGRPLLVLNGEKDPNCPVEGLEIAIEAARKAFHDVGADDRFRAEIARGVAHSVTPEHHDAAIAWFVRWLKPTAP